MIIGVPKEIKNNESRVALTPAGVLEMKKNGHTVYVQSTAGLGSGFEDSDYKKQGAKILKTIEEVYAKAEMIMKVKEPIKSEYKLIKKDQLVFTYFHFASYKPLTTAMIKSKAVCLAYETVELPDRTLPLLIPMSEVAGRMAIQQGAKYLEKPAKGRGVLLGGVPGVEPGSVLILGGGVVGTQAAKMAAGLGARVDQGGCIETCKPTTHEKPTFIIDDIVHYCVANMPGAVPYTSTIALANATLPYAVQLANKGWKKACQENASLRKGANNKFTFLA